MFDTQTPSNLPVEDIFEKTESKSAPPLAPMAPPRSSVPPAGIPPVPSRPSAPVPQPVAPRPISPVVPPSAPPPAPVVMQTPGQGWKKVLLIIGALVVLGVIGLAIKFFVLKKKTVTPPVSVPSTGTSAVTAPQVTAPASEAPPVVTAPPVVDSDNDGLSDDEELQLGTDPKNPDTDGDGLFDGEEVKVYHTNPLDKDTDKDGYLDGEEVQHGYNPNGPGKLYTVPPPAQ